MLSRMGGGSHEEAAAAQGQSAAAQSGGGGMAGALMGMAGDYMRGGKEAPVAGAEAEGVSELREGVGWGEWGRRAAPCFGWRWQQLVPCFDCGA